MGQHLSQPHSQPITPTLTPANSSPSLRAHPPTPALRRSQTRATSLFSLLKELLTRSVKNKTKHKNKTEQDTRVQPDSSRPRTHFPRAPAHSASTAGGGWQASATAQPLPSSGVRVKPSHPSPKFNHSWIRGGEQTTLNKMGVVKKPQSNPVMQLVTAPTGTHHQAAAPPSPPALQRRARALQHPPAAKEV